MAARMKLIVAYLGTAYHGWQRQSGHETVQGTIEKALAAVTGGHPICVVGAGRTDAGVHAAGQVAHCDLPSRIPPEALARALNRALPRDIRVRRVLPVRSSFHARYDARGKLYAYRLRLRPPPLPWLGQRQVTLSRPVDPDLFAAALGLLPGTRDWSSFTVTDVEEGGATRTLFATHLQARRDGFDIHFTGSGFLRYQVRRMVGAALEVGEGRRRLEELRELLDVPQAGARIRTAPAEGLCLERVYYRRSARLGSRPRPRESTG
jgi:tRNA pseudouridine38-40 synthase